MDEEKRILLTGGHGATTGIAVIEALKKKYPNVNLSWIGSRSVVSGSSATSLEYKIYPSMGVKYFSINAGKLQTKFTRYTIPFLLLIPIGFIQSLFLIIKIWPKVVLSFGGYSSFPVVFSAWLFGIPVILHEQTVVAGRASIASSFFAKKIALSRIESSSYFPKNKKVLTGNPVREDILLVKPKSKPGIPKTILIMGGSRGSEFINEEIIKIHKELATKYNLIHITGERDFNKYSNYANKNYQVISFVNPKEMPALYVKSDIIVSRSGANSVSELLIIKRPALLIPLPRTYMQEQVKNAEYATKFGLAHVMLEREVNSQSLLMEIDKIASNWQSVVDKVITKPSPDADASENVIRLLAEYI